MIQDKKPLTNVISRQYFGVLNSVYGESPYSNLVSFAISEDLQSLFFVTDRNTRKYQNIKKNPNVSFLIDNRMNKPADIVEATAVTVIGSAREEVENAGRLKEIFLARHPQLKQFVDFSSSALISITVHEYIIASFEKTQRIVM